MPRARAKLSPLFGWRSAIVDSTLPAPAKQIALTLSMHMSERGDSCYPSHATLATETSLSTSTVCLHLKTLEDAGFILRVPGAKGRSTRYSAAIPTGTDTPGGGVDTPRAGVPTPRAGDEDVKESVSKNLLPGKPADGWSKAERDLVWDSLVAVCGEPTTRSERGDFGKTAGELRAVIPRGADAADATRAMRVRRDRFVRRYPDATFSHRVLRNRWGALGERVETDAAPVTAAADLEDDGTGRRTF